MIREVFKIFVLCFAMIGIARAQETELHTDVQKIIQLLNSKNSNALFNMMADSCKIGNLPTTIDKYKVLPDILANFQGIDTYTWIADSVLSNGDQFVSLLVNYKNWGSGKPVFVFNKDRKLIELGIIKVKLTANPTQALASALASSTIPDTMRVKFTLFNDLIYVPAKLNGIEGFFMFDSGAPTVLLRKKYVPDHAINKDVSLDFTGMGGNLSEVHWSTGSHLTWGDIDLRSLDAPVMPLTEMDQEEIAVGPIFGLIGFSLFSGFQVCIDYDRQELLLERVDKTGPVARPSFLDGRPLATIPMRMRRHIPIIDVSIGGKSYPMGLDCGANSNLIKQEVVPELKDFLRFDGRTTNLLGVGKEQIISEMTQLEDVQMGSITLQPMSTVITGQAIGGGTGEMQLPLIGLLGAPFLKQFKTVFNFQEGYLYLY